MWRTLGRGDATWTGKDAHPRRIRPGGVAAATVANALSLLFQPVVTFSVLLGAIVANRDVAPVPAGVAWCLLALLPALTLAVGMRLGLWSDVEIMALPERRTYLPLCTLYAVVAAVWAIATGQGPDLRLISASVALWLLLSAVVSLVWKISLHEGATVGVVLLAAAVFGRDWGLALAWAPFAVAWARLRLGRHTPAQLAAGAAAALLAFAVTVRVLPLR